MLAHAGLPATSDMATGTSMCIAESDSITIYQSACPTTTFPLVELEPLIPCAPGSIASSTTPTPHNLSTFSQAASAQWTSTVLDESNDQTAFFLSQHLPTATVPRAYAAEEGGCSYPCGQLYNEYSPASSDMAGDAPARCSPLGGGCSSMQVAYAALSPGPSALGTCGGGSQSSAPASYYALNAGNGAFASVSGMKSPSALLLQHVLLKQQQQNSLDALRTRPGSSESFFPSALGLNETQRTSSRTVSSLGDTVAHAAASAASASAWAHLVQQQSPQMTASTLTGGSNGSFHGGTAGAFSMGIKRVLEDDTHLAYNQTMGPIYPSDCLTITTSPATSGSGMGNNGNTKNRDAQRRFRQRQRETFAAMEASVRAQEQKLQALYREKRMVEQHNEVLLKQLRAYEQGTISQHQLKTEEDQLEETYRPHLCCLCGSAILQQQQQAQHEEQEQQQELTGLC